VPPSDKSREIADRAVALATDDRAAREGVQDGKGASATLIKMAGNEVGPLEQAREVLVRRIRTRSNDFSATSGLSLLNKTLSTLGHRDDMEWQPKKWRIPH
jgi:hypothetical protein